MARYNILYWKDIPSVVEATDGDSTKKMLLSPRFQDLIDLVAMKTGLAGTDAYLEEWNRGDPIERDGSPEEVAGAVHAELESQFEAIKTAALGLSVKG